MTAKKQRTPGGADDLLGNAGGAANAERPEALEEIPEAARRKAMLVREYEAEAWRDFALAGRALAKPGEDPLVAADRVADFADAMLRHQRVRSWTVDQDADT